MTDEELLAQFRLTEDLLAELLRLSPLCEVEYAEHGRFKVYCRGLEHVFDDLTKYRMNPGTEMQYLVNIGLITQQERVAWITSYNQNKNNMKRITNVRNGRPPGGPPSNPGQGGGPP